MDTIKELQILGLTEYESKVYFTLVKFGEQNAREISRRSDVPQNRIYETCLSLQKYGLVDIILGSPKKFHAFNPEIAIKNLIDKKKEEIDNLYEHSSGLVKELKDLSSIQIKQKVGVWLVVGSRNDIAEKRNEIYQLIKKERKAIVSATRIPETKRLLRIPEKLAKKGIKMKFIINPTKNMFPLINQYKKLNIPVRTKNLALHFKINIIDEELAFIESNEGEENEWFLMWTNSSPIVKTLSTMFDLMWKEAKE